MLHHHITRHLSPRRHSPRRVRVGCYITSSLPRPIYQAQLSKPLPALTSARPHVPFLAAIFFTPLELIFQRPYQLALVFQVVEDSQFLFDTLDLILGIPQSLECICPQVCSPACSADCHIPPAVCLPIQLCTRPFAPPVRCLFVRSIQVM